MYKLLLVLILSAMLLAPVGQAMQPISVITSPAVIRALAYLNVQYLPAVGLFRASPEVERDRCWITTDGLLAAYAYQAVGRLDLADRFSHVVTVRHGLIEVLDGQVVAWPPYVQTQTLVREGSYCDVWQETKTSGQQFLDWEEYADLAFYGALNAVNSGRRAEALRVYRQALTMFDGSGFTDKAFLAEGGKLYSTYKLALAVIAAKRLGLEPDRRVVSVLERMQRTSGGFATHYDRNLKNLIPGVDENVETTSLVIMALSQR